MTITQILDHTYRPSFKGLAIGGGITALAVQTLQLLVCENTTAGALFLGCKMVGTAALIAYGIQSVKNEQAKIQMETIITLYNDVFLSVVPPTFECKCWKIKVQFGPYIQECLLETEQENCLSNDHLKYDSLIVDDLNGIVAVAYKKKVIVFSTYDGIGKIAPPNFKVKALTIDDPITNLAIKQNADTVHLDINGTVNDNFAYTVS